MYPKIINKIIELGDTLPALAGKTSDIGKGKYFLTEKDLEIEKKLTDVIQTFPGSHSVYAEELHDTFIENENVWVIDPISNTRNFLRGMPHYSVVLSHIHKGEIEFAVVYDPSNKELFTAIKGKGTYLNNKRVYVSKQKKDLFFLIYIVGKSFAEKALKIISKTILGDGNVIRIVGSMGIHYAYVACGRADAAISFNNDTFPEFAGKLLVEEAGGRFTDFEGGVLNTKTRGIIASNGLIDEQIKDLI